MRANRLDMTSDFTDLAFEGVLEISREDDSVIYRFSELTIAFLPPSKEVVKHIELDAFSVLLAREPPQAHIRREVAISATLDADNVRRRLELVEFRLPPAAIVSSDYIAFGLRGVVSTKFVAPLPGLPPEIVGRAIWPISARGNRWVENPDARRPQIRYKTPDDPNDPCAPERIR